MAFANEHITAVAVEATEFPDLARKYQVSGVPKTVVNDAVEIWVYTQIDNDAWVPELTEP